jgi:hypothetical protein
MKKYIRNAYNYVRILIAILYAFIMISDIYSSFIDEKTYERVYVGEYFYSMYANINMYRLLSVIYIILSIIYFYLVILHLNKLKDNKMLSVGLIITDILFILCRIIIFLNPWY